MTLGLVIGIVVFVAWALALALCRIASRSDERARGLK